MAEKKLGLPGKKIILLRREKKQPIYNDQLAAQLLKLPKKLPSRQPFLIHRSGGFHCHHAPDGTVAISPEAPGRGFASHGDDAGHAGEAQRWHHGTRDLRCGGLGRDLAEGGKVDRSASNFSFFWGWLQGGPLSAITHRIHVWYICLHLVDFYGKCR